MSGLKSKASSTSDDRSRGFKFESIIGLDKGWYLENIFLISPRKHMLWVFIRSASPLMSTQNIRFRGEITKISIQLD